MFANHYIKSIQPAVGSVHLLEVNSIPIYPSRIDSFSVEKNIAKVNIFKYNVYARLRLWAFCFDCSRSKAETSVVFKAAGRLFLRAKQQMKNKNAD